MADDHCVNQVSDMLGQMDLAPLTEDELQGVLSDCASAVPVRAIVKHVMKNRAWRLTRKAIQNDLGGNITEEESERAYNIFSTPEGTTDEIEKKLREERAKRKKKAPATKTADRSSK